MSGNHADYELHRLLRKTIPIIEARLAVMKAADHDRHADKITEYETALTEYRQILNDETSNR